MTIYVGLYRALNVAPTATKDEIKKAYRKLAAQLHPDVNPDTNMDEWHKVQHAYTILSDDDKRAKYDATGFDEVATEKTEIVGMMSLQVAFDQALEARITSGFGSSPKDWSTNNLIHEVRDVLRQGIAKMPAAVAEANKELHKLKNVLRRMRQKNPDSGPDIIGGMLKAKIWKVLYQSSNNTNT